VWFRSFFVLTPALVNLTSKQTPQSYCYVRHATSSFIKYACSDRSTVDIRPDITLINDTVSTASAKCAAFCTSTSKINRITWCEHTSVFRFTGLFDTWSVVLSIAVCYVSHHSAVTPDLTKFIITESSRSRCGWTCVCVWVPQRLEPSGELFHGLFPGWRSRRVPFVTSRIPLCSIRSRAARQVSAQSYGQVHELMIIRRHGPRRDPKPHHAWKPKFLHLAMQGHF
jgi:hypothetical protein